jgi:hypothetical protein
MSFPMSFHQALLTATGAHWLDDEPDLTCQDSTPPVRRGRLAAVS